MVITSGRDCAGVHIPFAAVGIEYGTTLDKSILAQMRARYQRQGREYSAECVTIINEAEAAMLA